MSLDTQVFSHDPEVLYFCFGPAVSGDLNFGVTKYREAKSRPFQWPTMGPYFGKKYLQ